MQQKRLKAAKVTETLGAAPVSKEAAENAVKASQIEGAAKVTETLGAASVSKEAAENAVEASQIVGAA